MSDDEWNPSTELAEEGTSPGNIGPLGLDADGSFQYMPHSPAGIQLKLMAMPEQVCLNSELVCTGATWALICQHRRLLQGLAFQVWPSALTLSHHAEQQHARQRWCWQVRLAAAATLLK